MDKLLNLLFWQLAYKFREIRNDLFFYLLATVAAWKFSYSFSYIFMSWI